MRLCSEISPVRPEDYPRIVEVWEASVRATHYFVSEPDVQSFKPVVREGLPQSETLVCMRDANGEVIGFIAVREDEAESLSIHPAWRGKGIGAGCSATPSRPPRDQAGRERVDPPGYRVLSARRLRDCRTPADRRHG
jgi:hypothetical protein